MIWQRVAKEYLSFSKKERWAAACLLVVGILVVTLPRYFTTPMAAGLQADSTLLNNAAVDAKGKTNIFTEERETIATSLYEPARKESFTAGELFTFDPNTLPAEGWQKLGLPDRNIRTLINYRSKGGRFYKRDDLKKIWGLPDGFYQRVAPYIQIADSRPIYDAEPSVPAYQTAKGKRNISIVSVNKADTAEWIALPGIGYRLATRILNFREKLGGFYSVDQIGETYGLPDSTFQTLKQYLQVDAGAVKKININEATKEQLRSHPYINWALANAIVEYRGRHGSFSHLQELKNILLVDEATFEKIAPYFSL